jgi:hypothetical protein
MLDLSRWVIVDRVYLNINGTDTVGIVSNRVIERQHNAVII